MKEFTVHPREAGQRLDKYLTRILPQASKGFIYKMLRKKNIVLNEKKASGQEVLQPEDSVRIYFSDETYAKFAAPGSKSGVVRERQSHRGETRPKKPLEIVYEDADVLIINKPAGMLSQKAAESDYSANEAILDYLLESGQLKEEELRAFRPSICNRLDRNTSGLLIAGKTIRGLQETAEALRDRTVKKYYRCLVLGGLDGEERLEGYLVKNHATNQVRIYAKLPGDMKDTGEKPAWIETAYQPVRQFSGFTLLEVHLITGRSHQIRAHLASIGHPILGDGKYGDADVNRRLRQRFHIRSQLLHAYRMEFPDGRVVTAPEPDIFARVERELTISERVSDVR